MSKKNKRGDTPTKITLPKDALSRVNLGQSFAEYDKVLTKPGVFVETPALNAAKDPARSKCFFVGRRGTGKTAITLYLGSKAPNVITLHPQLFETLADVLKSIEFTEKKALHSLVACFRRALLDELLGEWVNKRLLGFGDFPEKLRAERNPVESFGFDTRTLVFAEQMIDALTNKDDKAWTKQMNRSKDVAREMDKLRQGPAWDFRVLIDRIDDTWDGSDTAVILLVALMHACVDLAAQSTVLQPMLFLRENLLRRVREVDTEYTRIETAIVSMDWTHELLVEMIARRLHLLNINPKPPLEATWDLFFDEINGRSSAYVILEYCQRRPRDLIIFCSLAIDEAQAHKRSKVTADDVDVARAQFSRNRLKDLWEEYSENYPRIQLVLERFHGLGKEYTFQAIIEFVQKLIVDPEVNRYCGEWLSANAAPLRFIELLYNIGFFGVRVKNGTEYRSVGAKPSEMPRVDPTTVVRIHPCYEDALALQDIVVTSLDDAVLQTEGFLIDLPESFQLADYTKEIDGLLKSLDGLPDGRPGASKFEDLVGDVIKLCFFQWLSNAQSKPRTVSGTTVRDWVSANTALSGFWEMVKTRYKATQVIWECKNTTDLQSEDFQQAQTYMGHATGDLVIICFRGDPKELSYYRHIKEIHDGKVGGLVLLLNDSDLRVFLRQARRGNVKDAHIQDRFDYTVRSIA